jgi:hypothetical protein
MVEASPLDGPRRLGIRPGHPAVFRLSLAAGSASAVRVSGLPDGLQFDPSARIVRGRTRVRGNHALTISGEGKSAPWTDRVVIAVGDDICLTPPLGWNSWNSLGPAVSEEDVRRPLPSSSVPGWQIVVGRTSTSMTAGRAAGTGGVTSSRTATSAT